MRAALYARYSTGNQSPLSIGDQLRLCRAHAAKLGAHVVREFTDAEISGFVSAGRPGLNELLDFARRGLCDVVIAEHSDRLARDGEKGWQVFNLFRGLGVRYATVQEGDVTVVHQGVSALVSELKGEEVRERTRRGLQGVVEAGRSGGGLTYGYRKVRAYDGAGEPVRGLLEIDAAQAEVVRRIFREYAAGASPRAIAVALNAEHVPGPRSGSWNATTIAGNAERAVGILHNELYIGWRVWGRRTFVKDRETGSRRGRAAGGPPVRREVPELRIVGEELWRAARDQHARMSTGPMGAGLRGRRRPKRFLQGLIVCACCERALVRAGPRDALRCPTRVEKGACANTRAPGYAGIEARVFAAIRANLLHPELIEIVVADVQAGLAGARLGAAKRRARAQADLDEAKRRGARLLDQVADGALSGPMVRDKLAALEARRAQLEAELQAEAADDTVVAFPSAKRYRALLAQLHEALDNPDDLDSREAREAVRALIHQVRFTPAEGHGRYDLEIVGDLAPLLMLAAEQNAKGAPRGAPKLCRDSMSEVGAGTRFARLHTFRFPFKQAA